mmetsp:Transcript_27810/g.67628  ORF Transcript_27810/g.67628 Transcript_27810/m.67628 type:complete len:275 (+) Transcript_27810:98-922(+)
MLAVNLVYRLQEDCCEYRRRPNRFFLRWRIGYGEQTMCSRSLGMPKSFTDLLETTTGIISHEKADTMSLPGSFSDRCRLYDSKRFLSDAKGLSLTRDDIVTGGLQLLRKYQQMNFSTKLRLTRLVVGAEDFQRLERNTVKQYFQTANCSNNRNIRGPNGAHGKTSKNAKSKFQGAASGINGNIRSELKGNGTKSIETFLSVRHADDAATGITSNRSAKKPRIDQHFPGVLERANDVFSTNALLPEHAQSVSPHSTENQNVDVRHDAKIDAFFDL